MTVTVTNIRTTLLDSAYSTTDISDATITENISLINTEISDAAIQHENIAGYELNASIKDMAIKMGALWLTLMALHNKGVSRGMESQTQKVSLQTAKDYQDRYNDMLLRIRSGIYYGA